MKVKENKVVTYRTATGKDLPVQTDGETVWMTVEQMVSLLGRDRTVILRHINNAIKEGELDRKVNVQNLHIIQNGRGTQMPSAYANFRPIRCGYDAAFRGYATTRIGRACVLRASDANLGEKCLWRSPRAKRVEKGSLESQWRGRRSHSAFRQTLRIAQAICVQKRNIEVLKGVVGFMTRPSDRTSMDVSILLNGVCDVNGEPLLK